MDISILFSLFQSSFLAFSHSLINALFPYYLVYFKAIDLSEDLKEIDEFPYYLVYFKAGSVTVVGPMVVRISILFSLFQSSVWAGIIASGRMYFHTI